MAEILSQTDIDSLLSEIDAGDDLAPQKVEERKRNVSVYDFRHPNLVTKDQLRLLQMVHERYAKLVESYFTTKVRKMVDVKLMAVDQVTYSEFMLSVSDPSCVYILKIEMLGGEAIIEITLPLVYYFIDRLFGGGGKTTEDLREMTIIEQHVISTIAENIVSSLNKSWHDIYALDAVISGFQARPSFIQIASLEEMVISISLEVNVQETSGFVNLCFPFRLLEDILPKLSSDEVGRKRPEDESRSDLISVSKSLKNAQMPISAELGRKNISVEDLINLEVGDVIKLHSRSDSPLRILIENESRFLARPGISGNHVAVQIEEDIEY